MMTSPLYNADSRSAEIYFIGVTTRQSSIMKVFPKWADILGLDARIVGWDAPVGSPPAVYRRIVRRIKEEPRVMGALVTTHKIDLLRACRDLFDELDPYARICNEVSCIVKADGRLKGFAKDPISSGLALEHAVPAGHWQAGERDVLCLGAGGAAIAISVFLAERSKVRASPRRLILADILPERLDAIRKILDKLDAPMRFEYHLTQNAAENDALMRGLPGGSMVINATGLGKDRPGSPLTDGARFPQNGLVWELNYRGERKFMQQAQAQARERNLTVEDGWVYFLHGWTQAIAEIFQIQLTDETFHRLGEAAAALRPSSNRSSYEDHTALQDRN